ncbi:GNAT family N-acetyltransferase [Agromyces sp. NBRC 114283]|uniref:GNAT family N-acetyltransferase n=1 Tax=Agromyces sp. NBRC 114283 TaxID=2994521 RepID=UPI0024A42BEE|nr:GNAT family N-acetyltransferase [Agromyces sp. NBRC 114283]GLU90560.1 N-acetyltransferase [Agromyces sp. NBRC 114283]
MLEEEYQQRRVPPPHLRPAEPAEPPFEYVIRPATSADLPSVREIYNYYVTNSTVTFDEDAMSLREWRQKYAMLDKLGLPFLVAESPSGQLLGYALAAPWRQRRAYRYTVENSIYLGPAASGKGLGRALLTALIDAATAAGLREMIAVIADQGAEASLALHDKFGFVEIGRMGRVGFKFDRWLGTVLLQKNLR